MDHPVGEPQRLRHQQRNNGDPQADAANCHAGPYFTPTASVMR
jgi:hypothetical protein